MSNLYVFFVEDGQRLRNDSMEGVATDLLLGDANARGSLFNDSLDEDSHTATKTGISVSISSPAPEQHDLDDSLNFDTTQLPFDNEPLALSSGANRSDTVGDTPVESKYHSAGFELAQNISVSRPTESLHVENRESAEQSEPQSTCETGIATSSKAKTLSTASNSGGESTAAKTSKVVPSFGRRKTKTHSSPEGAKSSNEKSTADSLVPVGNQLADDRGIPNDGEGVAEEEGVREGEWKDQCVPQSSTGNTGKPQKPQFGGASKNKQPSKKSSTTRGSREERQNVTSKKKNLSAKVASSGDLNDENTTSKSESLANDNAATARESQTTAGNEQSTDKDSSSKLSSLSEKKEKKLAEREEKKREREEKKRQAEQKKLEREQKKREAETKKAEKERLKKERQLELERKKAEKEQKKIEQALKKAERMVGKEGKQSGTKGNKRSEQGDDTSSNTAESLPTTAQGVELADQGKEGVAEVNQLDTELETEPNQTEREENQLDPKLDPALKEKGQIHTERSKNEQTHQVQNQEAENEKVSGDGSVSGVTEPEEGASLPTAHSNVTNTLQPAFISVGYGHSPPASREPSQSAALLPEDTADEGACYMPASGDQEGVGDGLVPPADQESSLQENSPDTSTRRDSVLKERNTAEANPQEHQEGEDKENTSLPLTKDTCSTSEGKLKMVFGKQKNAPRKNDMKAKTAKRHAGTPSDATKPTKERNTVPKPAKKPPLFGTNNQNEKSLAKRKRAPTASSKPIKRARGGEDEVSSESSRRGGEGERRCSNVSSSVGPVWVQCEKTSCQKWRKLRDCSDPLSLPDSWTCSMNTGKESFCSISCTENIALYCKTDTAVWLVCMIELFKVCLVLYCIVARSLVKAKRYTTLTKQR